MYNDDDSRKSDEDYMRSLYDRFRQEVESGAPIEYYEIDELLDIYDFAQDEGDAMVQMFVFLTASRLYPQNREFEERLAFFLSYVSQDAANDMISRQGREDSALWDVLQMWVKCYPSGDPAPYIEDILKKYDSLDCETGLKIIDLLRDMDHRDLLVRYYPELAKRAEEPRGFAFEVAETIKDNDAYKSDARRIAEDLTRMEPFNIEAWLLLARIEFGLEHPEEALAAVDYALAIDPDHPNARLTRGVIMVVMDDKRREAVGVLNDVLAGDPLNIYAMEGLAEAYSREGDKAAAAEAYWKIIESGIPPASSSDPLLSIIELEPDNLEDYLHRYIDKYSRDEADWRVRAFVLLDKENYKLAARYLDFFHREIGFRKHVDFFLHSLYDAKMLGRYIEVFEQVSSDAAHPASQAGYFSLTDYLLLASAYLRTGRRDEAAQLCEAIERRKDKCQTVEDTLRVRGVNFTARLIHTLATTDNLNVDLGEFDPLTADFA